MNERLAKRIAEAYNGYSEEYAPVLESILEPMADEIVRLGMVTGKDRVMDLATGSGLVARRVTLAQASVVAVDISLGALVAAKSLSNGQLPFVVGDAHKLPFVSCWFDIVTCGLGLSHFVNVSIALGEVCRVLRSGGRFIASSWGTGSKNPSYSAAIEVSRKYIKDDPFVEALDEETWSDVDRGCVILRLAGFDDVQVSTLSLSGQYKSPSDAVDWAFAWPLFRYRIASLGRIEQLRLREQAVASVMEADDLRWQNNMYVFQATRTIQ